MHKIPLGILMAILVLALVFIAQISVIAPFGAKKMVP